MSSFNFFLFSIEYYLCLSLLFYMLRILPVIPITWNFTATFLLIILTIVLLFSIFLFFQLFLFLFFLSLFIVVVGILLEMRLYDFLLFIFSQRPTNSCFFDLDSQFDRLKCYISVNAIHEPLMILLNIFLCFLHYILMVLSQNF